MADELTINASIAFDDGADEVTMQVIDFLVTMGTTKFTKFKQTIGTAEEAIGLAEVTSPGWFFAINRDPTNYVEVRVATGGAKFAKLVADSDSDGKGGFCLLQLGSGAQVPYAIADTGACVITGFVASV